MIRRPLGALRRGFVAGVATAGGSGSRGAATGRRGRFEADAGGEPLRRRRRTLLLVTWLGIAAYALTLTIVASGRGVLNYRTETDFVGSFVHEAARFQRGEPLLVEFHPPLYPVVLALVQRLVPDWFTTGLVVSLASSAATMAMSWVLLRLVFGLGAALGGVIALAVSPTFASYSMQATSDLFSLALYVGAVLAVFVSVERRTVPSYLLAGLVIGLGLIARTNNVVLLGLLLFYLIPLPGGARATPSPAGARAVGLLVVGLLVPVLAWYGFAAASGAPFLPTKNHENLALTYFSDGGRISGDERYPLAEQFRSTADVLSADPARIARTFLTDLVRTTSRILTRDTALPVPLVALGVLATVAMMLWDRTRRPFLAILLLNLGASYLLLNAKAYEHRYYLYLVPFVGAAIGHLLARVAGATDRAAHRRGAVVAAAALVAFASATATVEVRRLHALEHASDAQAAGQVLATMGAVPGSAVYSRKPHVAYYSGLVRAQLPDLASLEELMSTLGNAAEQSRGDVYLFYGEVERRTRPQYAALGERVASGAAGVAVAGDLRLVASGPERDGWRLFAVAARPGSSEPTELPWRDGRPGPP
jgi:hypothetical protein